MDERRGHTPITPLMSIEEACKSLGQRVATYRKVRDISAELLAEQAKITTEELIDFENNGKADFSVVVKLSLVMDQHDGLEPLFNFSNFKTIEEYLDYHKEMGSDRWGGAPPFRK